MQIQLVSCVPGACGQSVTLVFNKLLTSGGLVSVSTSKALEIARNLVSRMSDARLMERRRHADMSRPKTGTIISSLQQCIELALSTKLYHFKSFQI